MTCLGGQDTSSPPFPDTEPCTYHRARRPALIPPNCSLTPAETEELVRTRIHQPLFPPPDPRLLRHIRSCSLARTIPSGSASPEPDSPCSDNKLVKVPMSRPVVKHDQDINATPIPPSIARDPRRRAAWLKARAHYSRDYQLKQSSSTTQNGCPPSTPLSARTSASVNFRPKRKHSELVIYEERISQLEDRVGTPHLSELAPGEDVLAQLNIGELQMDNKVSEPLYDRHWLNPHCSLLDKGIEEEILI